MPTSAAADLLLRAGALLPAGTAFAPDVPTDELGARTYRHPVLAEPVVTLTPAATAAGDDLVMDFLGFGEPAVQPAVAQAVRRAPGFPGWALINDPRHARHALDVVKAMKAAGRRARVKPGHAWEAFDAIAKQLGRSTAHFLPSYWEEVGRAFIEAENATYATRAFGKAREAEQVHALRVDPAAQREAMLEFALRGAVSIKALEEYARTCLRRDGPEATWLGFRDLCLKRCQGGLPPWSGMFTELMSLARAAGRDGDTELMLLVAALLPMPAARQAEAFWLAARPAFARLAVNLDWARGLLDLVPEPGGREAWYATWVEWLDEWGLIAHLEAGALPDGSPLAVVPWFERMCWRCLSGRDDKPDLVLRLTERLAGRLRAAGRPLRLTDDDDRPLYHIDLVELALSLDLPLADPPRYLRLSLHAWAEQRPQAHPAHGRDPQRTAADPRFRRALRGEIAAVLDKPPLVEVMLRAPALLGLIREIFADELAEATAGGLPAAEDFAAWLTKNLTPPLRQALPEAAAQAATFPVATCLARTLRGGLVDELGWPALDAAIGRLRTRPDVELSVSGQAPFAVVRNAARVEVVGPEATVLTCDLELPPGARTSALFYRDGHLFHAWHVNHREYAVSWSHEPQRHHPWKGSLRDSFGDVQIELPGGGTCTGQRAWRVGDPKPDCECLRVLSDGRTIWVERDDTLHEFDPATGDVGRASRPAFLEAAAGPERTLEESRCILHPYPGDGAVIRRDGLVGLRVERLPDYRWRGEALDGTTWTGDTVPVALLRWPGDEAGGARALSDGWRSTLLHAAEGWASCRIERSWNPGQPFVLPAEFWPALRVRDAVASAALRRWRDEDAAALLATAASELPSPKQDDDEDDDDDDDDVKPVVLTATTAAAAALLPGHTDARLPAAVAAVARIAAQTARSFAAVAAAPEEQADVEREELVEGGGRLLEFDAGKRPVATLRRLGAYLRAGPGPGRMLTPVDDWDHLARLDYVGFTVTLTGYSPYRFRNADGDLRLALAAWCEAFATSGLCDLPGRLRQGRCTIDRAKPPLPLEKTGHVGMIGGGWVGGSAFLLHGDHRFDDCEVVEYAPDGVFRGLPTAPFTKVQDLRLPERRRLEAWAAVLRLPPRPPPAAALIDRTAARLGTDRAVAALLLAGLPNLDDGSHNFLDKDLREALGLKVAEAAAARDILSGLSRDRQTALASALVGDDPAGLLEMDRPGSDGRSPVDRLVAAWKSGAGFTQPITDRLRADHDLQQACTAALAGEQVFPGRVGIVMSTLDDGDGDLDFQSINGDGVILTRDLLEAAWRAACDVHLHQPWDAPAAKALTALVPHIDRVLDDADSLLPIDQLDRVDHPVWKALARAWDELGPQRGSAITGISRRGEQRDDGVLVLGRCDDQFLVAMHPNRVRDEASVARFLALAAGFGREWLDVSIAQLVAVWRSPRARGLLAALASGPAPGACAGDPRISAASVVAAAAARLNLSADAAAAYLMVLALAEPTDALLRRLLGWDEARLETALDEAVKRKLLLAAKRRRAGRTRFLPGGWEDLKDPYLPLETWKLPLYGGERRAAALVLPPGPLLPDRALGELYADAWQRVVDSDAPRYEEVR